MSKGDYEESPLHTSVIYRGIQTVALSLYVPLPVLLVEVGLFFLLAKLMGFWCIAFMPLHAIPVIKTARNPHWVRDVWQDINRRWLVGNKGSYGKGVVSFHVKPPPKK